MDKKFVVRPKNRDTKEEKSVAMSIRIDKRIQEEYDNLSYKSERSRNELICLALQYALDNLEFITNDTDI